MRISDFQVGQEAFIMTDNRGRNVAVGGNRMEIHPGIVDRIGSRYVYVGRDRYHLADTGDEFLTLDQDWGTPGYLFLTKADATNEAERIMAIDAVRTLVGKQMFKDLTLSVAKRVVTLLNEEALPCDNVTCALYRDDCCWHKLVRGTPPIKLNQERYGYSLCLGYTKSDRPVTPVLAPDEWVCTDSDSCQYVKALDDLPNHFRLIEIGLVNPDTAQYEVYTDDVCVNDYFNDQELVDELENILRGFGYSSISEAVRNYGDSAPQVIAECIFEHYGSFQAESVFIGREEECRSFVQKWITQN